MPSRSFARLAGVLGIGAVLGLAACTENIDSSAACPLLCPPQSIELRDTLIEGVAFDTSIAGYPGLGLGGTLLLARDGDAVDARVVVRFDSLPSSFAVAGVDSAITRVDTATLSFRLAYPLLVTETPVIVEAYDVDTTATDTLPETLLPLFRADRLLATESVAPSSVPDSTLRIFLDTGAVRRRIADKSRLRIGLRVRPGTAGQLALVSTEGGIAPSLALRVSRDTALRPLIVSPRSTTPVGPPFPAVQLVDYQLFAALPAAAAPSLITVGGLRGQRGLLRFDLPDHIVDSATVVRATLELTQVPYRGPRASDTLTMFAHTTLGSAVVTDLRRVAGLLGGVGPDTLNVVASDSGRREIELAGLVRQWSTTGVKEELRAIVLRVPTEQERVPELRFFSREAPAAAVRPRLRLIYVPRTVFGQP